MSWLHYLLEANIYLAVFYLLYFALLNNTTHYKMNRVYLLATSVAAYIIPVMQIGALKRNDYGDRQLTTVILNNHVKPGGAFTLTLQDFLLYAYIIGTVITLGVLIFKLIQLIRLTKAQKTLLDDGCKLIALEDSNTAFSFFNYVFIGTKVSGADTILRHELVHISQKHSLDILFLEFMKIISWFNPFIYLVQRSLKTVHEYIADEHTAAYENDTLAYSSFLVNNAYGVSGTSITHSFFNYNLLKKRIIMLNQKRSGNLARLKYLAALPVCAGLLCVSTLGFSKTYGWVDIAPQQSQKDTLKLTDVKAESVDKKVKDEINLQRKKAETQQKNFQVKIDKKQEPVSEIRIDTVPDSDKYAKPLKTLLDSKADTNDKKVGEVKIVGKAGTQKTPPPPPPRAPVYVGQQKTPPPPPPPAMSPPSAFGALSKYMAKYVRFPAIAKENNVMGSVVLKFDLTSDHKVTNAIVIKGIGSGCDEEALRALKSYTGTVDSKAGTYKLAVTFYVEGKELKKTASSDLFDDPSFVGEVTVTAYP